MVRPKGTARSRTTRRLAAHRKTKRKNASGFYDSGSGGAKAKRMRYGIESRDLRVAPRTVPLIKPVRELRELQNDVAAVEVNSDATYALCLNQIPDGPAIGERQGRLVRAQQLEIRGAVEIFGTTTAIRILVVRDDQTSAGAVTYAAVMGDSDWDSLYPINTKNRFTIYKDLTWCSANFGGGSGMKPFHWIIPMNHLISFSGANAGDYLDGSVWIVATSNLTAAQTGPELEYNAAFRFTDA